MIRRKSHKSLLNPFFGPSVRGQIEPVRVGNETRPERTLMRQSGRRHLRQEAIVAAATTLYIEDDGGQSLSESLDALSVDNEASFSSPDTPRASRSLGFRDWENLELKDRVSALKAKRQT